MRRGSTPTNVFELDIDLHDATVFVSYEQDKTVVIEKTNDDLSFSQSGNVYTITLTLSQEDTLKFHPGKVEIQIRYVFPTGAADASEIIPTTFERIIKDGVITP